MKSLALVLVSLAALAACGSKAPAAGPTTPGNEPAKVALPDAPFETLDHDQQIAFMKQKVLPAMEPIFKQHDATRFAEFNCMTCHGEGAKTGHFDMPNPKLPTLSKDSMPTFKKEDVEWMATQVKPTMAKLLQQAEWTPETKKGFGCGGCHPAHE
jgi:cytochrome c553